MFCVSIHYHMMTAFGHTLIKHTQWRQMKLNINSLNLVYDCVPEQIMAIKSVL